MKEEELLEQNQLLSKLDKYFISAIEHPTTRDFIKNAQKDFEFREGKQWTDDEKKELKDRGQPDITENEIKPKLDRLTGQYKKQKTRIGYRGRNVQQDEPIANTLSDLVLHIQQRSNYEFEEAEMFDDGIVSGVGWVEPYVTFDEIFSAEVKIRQHDCLNVFPDPFSKKYDLSDAYFICIAKWVHIDEAKALYPNFADRLESYYNLVGIQGNLAGIDTLRNDNYVDTKNKRIRLVEIRHKKKIKQKVAVYSDPQTGMKSENLAGKSDAYVKKLLKQNPNTQIIEKLIENIEVCVFCGSILLEEKDLPHDYQSFYLIPYYVYRKKSGEPYGVVRMLIDPQTEVNKRRSKALHLLNTNQTIAEQNAIPDEDAFRKELAKPDGIAIVRTGSLDKVKVEKNIEVAQTQMNLLGESKDAMQRIANIPNETPSGEIRSGVGLARKEAMVQVPITPIFENLRRTRLLLGKHLYELMKQYYTEEKIFYITDSVNQARQVSLTQEHIARMKESIYDVIVEEMPDTATIQDEQFQVITQLLQSFNLPPQLAMAMMPLVIEMSNVRDKKTILDKFNQMMQPSPVLPKMSLNLNWDALTFFEKATFAQMLGQSQLAQMEMQTQTDPSFITKAKEGIAKTQIKAQADTQKNQLNPQDMQHSQDQHMMDMQHSQDQHTMKMNQSAQQHDVKMQQMDEQGLMKLIQEIVKIELMKQQPQSQETAGNA